MDYEKFIVALQYAYSSHGRVHLFHVDSSLEEMGRTVALFVVLSFVTVSNTMKIAICVTGQKGRLHLDHLQESVLEVNARSASPLELNLFIFLQTGVTIFNTITTQKVSHDSIQ